MVSTVASLPADHLGGVIARGIWRSNSCLASFKFHLPSRNPLRTIKNVVGSSEAILAVAGVHLDQDGA